MIMTIIGGFITSDRSKSLPSRKASTEKVAETCCIALHCIDSVSLHSEVVSVVPGGSD